MTGNTPEIPLPLRDTGTDGLNIPEIELPGPDSASPVIPEELPGRPDPNGVPTGKTAFYAG